MCSQFHARFRSCLVVLLGGIRNASAVRTGHIFVMVFLGSKIWFSATFRSGWLFTNNTAWAPLLARRHTSAPMKIWWECKKMLKDPSPTQPPRALGSPITNTRCAPKEEIRRTQDARPTISRAAGRETCRARAGCPARPPPRGRRSGRWRRRALWPRRDFVCGGAGAAAFALLVHRAAQGDLFFWWIDRACELGAAGARGRATFHAEKRAGSPLKTYRALGAGGPCVASRGAIFVRNADFWFSFI